MIRYAKISVTISQKESDCTSETILDQNSDSVEACKAPMTTLHIRQTLSPGSFDSDEVYPIDGRQKQYSFPLFGNIAMQLRYMNTSKVSDQTLRQQLTEATASEIVIEEVSHNLDKGWDSLVI